MGLLEALVGKVDFKEIEAQALEAKKVQGAMLLELKDMHATMRDVNTQLKMLVQIMLARKD